MRAFKRHKTHQKRIYIKKVRKKSSWHDFSNEICGAGRRCSTVYTSLWVGHATKISGISGSASYDLTSDDEHELGLDTSKAIAGVSVDAGLDWNIDDSSFDASVGTGYSAFGLDGSATSYWNISDFGFTGLD